MIYSALQWLQWLTYDTQLFGTGYTISERELRIFYELGSQKNVKIISFQRLAILFQKGNLEYLMMSDIRKIS